MGEVHPMRYQIECGHDEHDSTFAAQGLTWEQALELTKVLIELVKADKARAKLEVSPDAALGAGQAEGER